MTKIESLNNLKRWEYNVPLYLTLPIGTKPSLIELRKLGDAIGIRTYKDSQQIATPFFKNLAPKDARPLICDLHTQGYHCIAAKLIPPEWTIISVELELHPDLSGRATIVRGPSWCKDVEVSANTESVNWSYLSQIQSDDLREIISYCKDIPLLAGNRSIIIEASLLRYLAGYKRETIVLWEYR